MVRLKINYSFFNTSLTGGTRVLFEIANRLVEKGHEVTVTSLGSESDHTWFPLEASINYVKTSGFEKKVNSTLKRYAKFFPDKYANSARVRRLPGQIKALEMAIPECDVNIATYCFSAYSVVNSGKGIPFYHMQHFEPYFFDDPELIRLAEQTYHLPLNKIVNSMWLAKQMEERYGEKPPIVNPAIDHTVFYPRKRQKLTSELSVLCFAKQARWKGFPEALVAMKLIARKKKNVKFIAFGLEEPSYKAEVPYEFIKAPSDDQLAALYTSADVVMCPSWYESFPLYPLEAMACGAPIVTTPFGTEDYASNERNCLVIPPKDPQRLAEAVLRLLDDESLRETFSTEGRKTSEAFTWERSANSVEALLLKRVMN